MGEYFTKADAEEFKEELKRYLGILAEDFQQKLNFVIDAQEDIKGLIRTTNEETKRELRLEFRSGLKETEDKLRSEFRAGLNKVEKDIGYLKKEVSEIKAEVISHRDNTEIKEIKKKKKT